MLATLTARTGAGAKRSHPASVILPFHRPFMIDEFDATNEARYDKCGKPAKSETLAKCTLKFALQEIPQLSPQGVVATICCGIRNGISLCDVRISDRHVPLISNR